MNATLGQSIITGDPNPKNENGRFLEMFLVQNKLTAVNSLSLCKGVITRLRLLVTGKIESSTIDFYVVCERVLAFVSEMLIDSDKKHIATNYTNVKKGGEAKDTDHYTQIMKVRLEICPYPEKRQEIFNFKNTQCQEVFKDITNKTKDFHKCFEGNVSNAIKFSKWRGVLNTYCGRAFKKIRVRQKKLVTNGAEKLIDKRNQLKKLVETKTNSKLQREIDILDKDIATILHNKAKCNAFKFRKFCDKASSFPVQLMWKLKKRLWPKKKSTLPVAKWNQVKKLVSSPREIKAALFQEYKERLRTRKIRPDFQEQKKMDIELVNLKLIEARLNKSSPFLLTELEKALNDLNQGRARDPEGLCAELFQNKVIGESLKESLLIMLNEIKQEGIVPYFMNVTSVTTIPKAGSKFMLTNERGIFKVSILRTILLRLLYNRNYMMVNNNMSDSNIGARRGKSCRNHIWILNGINHEHHSSKKKTDLRFNFYDYKQMFDSIVLSETLSDMHSVGVNDDSLVLIKALNTNIAMSINTPYGATETTILPAVVAQGDLMAPLEAAVQVDNIAKNQIKEEHEREIHEGSTILYKYKGIVPIPILGMMDDTATVTEAGFKTEIMNAHIVTHTANKILQFNDTKCKTMKIGKNHKSIIDQDIEVDMWVADHDKQGKFHEEYRGKAVIQEAIEYKYLGFVISSSASNVPNFLDKKGKVAGTHKNILNMIRGLASYTFECLIIYLKSMMRGTILNACETCYDIKENEYRIIESYEERLLIDALKTGSKCPRAILYLDLGVCPARFIVKKYKLNSSTIS